MSYFYAAAAAAAAAVVLQPPGLSGTTLVSWYQKGKTNLDLRKQEIASGSGISWAICKSAPRLRQNNHASISPLSFFTGQMPILPPN